MLSSSYKRILSQIPTKSATTLRAFSTAWWGKVEMGPKDPILGVTEKYNEDTSPSKLNLGVGAYRDDDGKPVVLKSVIEAQHIIHQKKLDNEYAPIAGVKTFVNQALKLAYGNDSQVLKDGRVAAAQSLSGTGALRLAGEFINRFHPMDVYLPSPTWGNHIPIFKDSGLQVKNYRYYDAKTKGLDLNGLLEDADKAPNGSCFLFHACAHNPTGVDPKTDQWLHISKMMKQKQHFVLVDMAYQGFASGDTAHDAQSVRIFLNDGHQIGLCQSFAKNFGLYGQRVGCVSFVTSSAEETARVESQIKIIARPIYSNPPVHGARLISTILSDEKLEKQWRADVKEMADRIISMRRMLFDELKSLGSKHNWQHIIDQIGMFCYSGLTADQVARLTSQFHIYLTSNGRISMAGVTSKNVKYLAKAIHEVTK